MPHVTRHMLQVQQQKAEYTEYFAQEQGMGARAALRTPPLPSLRRTSRPIRT